jgi:tetratricopeptide (TPR) repeat protein
MTMTKNKRVTNLILLVLIVGIGLVFITSKDYLNRHRSESNNNEQDLYLPEANYLKFISLGHTGLVSDLVLAKALTYFGSHYYERQTFRFKHLKKLFFTAVEMDPMNKDAILMAGNILSDIDMPAAIEILERGRYYHPDSWKFPEMIGFQYYFKLKDAKKAAKYYELASRLPGHPPYVPSISGKLYEESGRYEEAIRVLYNFYSTTEDKRLKESFKQSILELQEKMKKRKPYPDLILPRTNTDKHR